MTGRAQLTPLLALVAQHVAVVAWGSVSDPAFNAAAEVLATTMTLTAILVLVRWSRGRLPGFLLGEGATRNLTALTVALVVVLGNALMAVVSTDLLLWYRFN